MQNKIEIFIQEVSDYFDIEPNYINQKPSKKVNLPKQLTINLILETQTITQKELSQQLNTKQQNIQWLNKKAINLLRTSYRIREQKKELKEKILNALQSKSLKEYWQRRFDLAQTELNKLAS